MSDFCDRSEACAEVTAAGAVFVNRNRCAPAVRAELPPCTCGGRPRYQAAAPMYGKPCEFLACPDCGNSAGPYPSRQQLATAWRLSSPNR